MRIASKVASAGFSLTELLVTLAVASILVGIALPSFRLFSQNQNVAAQANQLVSDLNAARVEAVKLASFVRVSPVSGSWNNGWVVATDSNQNGTVDGTDVLLRQAPEAVQGFSWSLTATPAGPVSNVFYGGNGYLSGNQTLLFQLRTPDGNAAHCRRVAVALSGRAEVQSGSVTPCT
ncbi:GspH/FimT family pseudopilin [Ahniella affigens]|nr:GspH/FimT family pseudopilin [Ahniella affigens]